MSGNRVDNAGASPARTASMFVLVLVLILGTGFVQSWNSALFILNMGLISAVMALGVNLQWGIAGLFNVGVMGFVALGGLAVVLMGMPPVGETWAAGGVRVLGGLALGVAVIVGAAMVWAKGPKQWRGLMTLALLVVGFIVFRAFYDAGVDAIESINPASTGYLGGLNFGGSPRTEEGLPKADLFVLLAWPVGGLLAAGAAWIIGKTALGLRSDYLAIATLGIAEIVIAVLKNEDWLTRGVKNVTGLPRPVPYEVTLQQDPTFVERATGWGFDVTTASTITVKLGYSLLFASVLIVLLVLSQLALNSPWGRMMRAIRDNEVSARAMGKDVTARHLQVFILGSAICGIAGAMMTTLDGQLTPSSYQPLRFTFLVWVMVIVGGSGNNLGAVLGGFVIWFLWVQVDPMAQWLMGAITSGMAEDSGLRMHLVDSAQHLKLLTMGVILLVVLRFSPRGLLPER